MQLVVPFSGVPVIVAHLCFDPPSGGEQTDRSHQGKRVYNDGIRTDPVLHGGWDGVRTFSMGGPACPPIGYGLTQTVSLQYHPSNRARDISALCAVENRIMCDATNESIAS